MTLRSESSSFLKPINLNSSVMSNSSTVTNTDNSSFLEPSQTKKSGTLRHFASQIVRKRKRRGGLADQNNDSQNVDEDTFDSSSVSSFDLSSPPEIKRKKSGRMARMNSLASVISTPMAKVGHAFHRSISSARLPPSSPSPSLPPAACNSATHPSTPTKFFNRSFSTAQVAAGGGGGPTDMKMPDSPFGTLKRGGSGRGSSTHLTPYRPPQPTPNKQRETRFWSSDFSHTCSSLKRQEVKHQEAIYEISCGEKDLVEDMKLVENIYRDSLLRLKILTPSEVELIFGRFKFLPPLHLKLSQALRGLRAQDTGISKPIGSVLLDWANEISESYIQYCGSLVESKAFLDARMQSDKDFSDFLQRCLESPFSRKLDLWSFLDVPRSRLVKYPLLMKQVLKFSECAKDKENLASAIQVMEGILQNVDRAMAQANCKHTISRLDWLDENLESMECVRNATEEMLEGVLKNNRGTKLECHLLDTVLILGRPVSRGNNGIKRLQVYRTPIPVEHLVVEDLDGYTAHGSGSSTGSHVSSKQGSFKSAFSNNQTTKSAKNSFKVGFRESELFSITVQNSSGKNRQTCHTLVAKDEHSKRQWLTVLQKTIETYDHKNKTNRFLEDLDEETDANKSVRTSCRNSLGKNNSSSSRVALFQKNKRSPRIKASLSSTHIENLRKGGGVKKIRSTLANTTSASTSKLLGRGNNTSKSDLVDNTPLNPRPRPRILQQSGGSRKKINPELGGLKPNTNPKAVARTMKDAEHLRIRTKSWNHLWQESEDAKQDRQHMKLGQPRYLTRSKHKISKSMSDLMQM